MGNQNKHGISTHPAASRAKDYNSFRRTQKGAQCPLLAQSGHSMSASQCPLLGVNRTSGVKERRPWYEPSEKLPDQPIVNAQEDEFESLVVEMPSARDATGKKPLAVVENQD
jgi:hypothetical protein